MLRATGQMENCDNIQMTTYTPGRVAPAQGRRSTFPFWRIRTPTDPTLVLFGFAAALVFAATAPVFAQSDPGLANGLDAYWNFDETSGGILYDSSANGPNGFNGTLVNYPNGQGNWVPGLFGNALAFGGPGSEEYVSVPNFDVPSSSMTLTAWVYANSIAPWAAIAGNWSNQGYGAFSYATFGSEPNPSLYVADEESGASINIDSGSSLAGISTGRWYFLAFVANAQTRSITFAQNGVEVNSFGYTGQLLASSSQLTIGGIPSGGGTSYWDGEIDDMAIWTRALSSQDLATIYNAGLNGQSLQTLLVPEPSLSGFIAAAAALFVWWRAGRANWGNSSSQNAIPHN